MKIAVELLFHNDIKNLQRLLPTINGYVDMIFAIEGRTWTDKKYYEGSTDGSSEYLKSFDNVLLERMDNYEYQKRQHVCELCRLYGFPNLIIIDSDEYVIGNWDDFKQNWQNAIEDDVMNYALYKVQIQRLDSTPREPIYGWQPVLWREPWQFMYQQRHDYFKRINESSTYYIRSYQNVEGIKLNHDHSLRTPASQKIRQGILDWYQMVDKPL